jgi:putative intracellular protease/amidase
VKKILFLASNYGLWGEELQAPWDACRKAGMQAVLATYKGITPLPLSVSTEAGFVDPVQNVVMTPDNVAARVNEILDNGEWDNPLNVRDVVMSDYDALAIIGGPGAGFDITGSMKVHSLVAEAYSSGKIIAAICAAVATLGYVRHPERPGSLVRGKRVAAHPRSWDFDFDLPYVLTRQTPQNNGSTMVTPGFILPVENIMQDATGDPNLVSAIPSADREHPVVIWDEPFLTAQSVESSDEFGRKLVEVVNG